MNFRFINYIFRIMNNGEDVSLQCRLCSSKFALISLNGSRKNKSNRDVIKQFAETLIGIEFEEKDIFHRICFTCVNHMYNFHIFRTKSLANDERLQALHNTNGVTVKSSNSLSKSLKLSTLCDKNKLYSWLFWKGETLSSSSSDSFISINSSSSSRSILKANASTQTNTVALFNVGVQTNFKPSVFTLDDKETQTQVEENKSSQDKAVQCDHGVVEASIQCELLVDKPVVQEKTSPCTSSSTSVNKRKRQLNKSVYESNDAQTAVDTSKANNSQALIGLQFSITSNDTLPQPVLPNDTQDSNITEIDLRVSPLANKENQMCRKDSVSNDGPGSSCNQESSGLQRSPISPISSGLVTVNKIYKSVNICKECDFTLYTQGEYKRHRKAHMVCTMCKKRFHSVSKTKQHSLTCMKNTPYVQISRMEDSEETLKAYPSVREHLRTPKTSPKSLNSNDQSSSKRKRRRFLFSLSDDDDDI